MVMDDVPGVRLLKPHTLKSVEELRAERSHWEDRLASAQTSDETKIARHFMEICDAWIEYRTNPKP
jgi:hypothetical protein